MPGRWPAGHASDAGSAKFTKKKKRAHAESAKNAEALAPMFGVADIQHRLGI